MSIVALTLLIGTFRADRPELHRIVLESIPVLSAGLLLSSIAGLVLENQLVTLAALPAVFAMQPALVSSAGAIGGILAGRVATKLHIGTVDPTMSPGREVRSDGWFLLGLSFPILVLNAVGAMVVADVAGDSAPALGWLLVVGLVAGVATIVAVTAIGYYATIGAWRLEVDPDTFGTPIVTSSVDFIGTVALLTIVLTLGLG